MALEVTKAGNNSSFYKIKSEQGPVPETINGYYTDSVRAQKALDEYNKSKERQPDKRLKQNKS